ncbi:MAG: protein kinase, partial [Pseudomonadota bacterium]
AMAGKPGGTDNKMSLTQEDFVWFMQSGFFDAIPDEAKFHLFANVRLKTVGAKERFIKQGDEGDALYIIRQGTCEVVADREGSSFQLGRLGSGDIVGEMALLTGERRTANVIAETEMSLWEIARDAFDSTCSEYPELRKFLTNLLNKRFSLALVRGDLKIGKYLVDKVLGKGGFSVVYKGTHSTLGMPVSIKMLKHNMAMDPTFVDEFRNEAKAIAQLNHENIVKVYDVEELFRTFFIVMELVEGQSLAQVLAKRERPSGEKLISYLLQICAGLSHAHERGVVHRDVKPGNILIQEDDKLKIVDFGLACAPGTREQVIRGTASYACPEQITGKPVDQRADIYSLGMMAYEMFTGENAFKGEDLVDVFRQHLQTEFPDPRRLVPDLPDEVHRFLMRAAQKDPALRYQSIDQVLYELAPLAEKMGLQTGRGTGESINMMSLFLFYRDGQRATMQKLVKEFSRELEKLGGSMRGANFNDLPR